MESPYKGPGYFTFQDRKLFFGRDRDARRILDMIQAQRLSMVHAASGAGKTSLLRARVIPELDNAGLDTIYCRPGPTPEKALRASTLLRVLSPPLREVAAFEHATGFFPQVKNVEDKTLGWLREQYAAQPVKSRAHRGIIADRADEISSDFKLEGSVHTAGFTMVARLLALRNGLEVFHKYLCRLLNLVDKPPRGLESPEDLVDISIGNIKHFLKVIENKDGYKEKLKEILSLNNDLLTFFSLLSKRISRKETSFQPSFILIIDQFEEFSTRFGDVTSSGEGRSSTLDYQVREKFFDELANLLKAANAAEHASVSLVISTRDDYVTRVGGIELRCGALLPSQKCEVPELSFQDIGDVVRGPSEPFGMAYDDEAIVALQNGLKSEGKFILPVKLQIVCERLWQDWSRDGSGGSVGVKELSRYAQKNKTAEDGVRAILDDYFPSTLHNMSEAEQMDAMLVLSSMITFDGTREPVTSDRLSEASLVAPKLRKSVLEQLVEKSIISYESLGGSNLIEIRHEFLINPIRRQLQEFRDEHPVWLQFALAMKALEGQYKRGAAIELDRHQLAALHKHADMIDEKILRAGLSDSLFALSSLESSGIDRKTRKSWLVKWAKFIRRDRQLPLTADMVASAAKGGKPMKLESLLSTVDWSFVKFLETGQLAYLIETIIMNVPSENSGAMLLDICCHAQVRN